MGGAGGTVEASGAVVEGIEASGGGLAGRVAAAAVEARHAAGTLLDIERHKRRLRPRRVVELVGHPVVGGV